MARAFSDLASLHTAISAIALGAEHPWTNWHQQSVVELTHLLLQEHVQVLPGLRGGGGMHELHQIVLKHFRELEFDVDSQHAAKKETIEWATESRDDLVKAWEGMLSDPACDDWLDLQRRFFWTSHVRRHQALFDREFIPILSPILGADEKYLGEVHTLCSRSQQVEEWYRNDLAQPEAKLADKAWVLSGLIRGKYYQYVGNDEQLLIHPFRRFLPYEEEGQDTLPISNTETYLMQVLIGSALNESGGEEGKLRVNTWSSNIQKVKSFFPRSKGILHLPDLDNPDDAAELARSYLRKANIIATSTDFENAIRRFIGALPRTILAVTVHFWPAKYALGEAYKELDLDQKVVKAITTRDRQYNRLVELAAGKIQYDFKHTLAPSRPRKALNK
jgi:hypothetical protein